MLKYGYNTARSKGKKKKMKFKKKVLANATDLRFEMLMFSRGGKWEVSGAAFQQGCVCTGFGLKWQLILCQGRRRRDGRTDEEMKELPSRVCGLPFHSFPKGTCGSCLFQLMSELLGRWVIKNMGNMMQGWNAVPLMTLLFMVRYWTYISMDAKIFGLYSCNNAHKF